MSRATTSHRPAARFRVSDPEQLAALESPLRLQIVDTAAALGPCSVSDLARQVGRKRESLYFHVARLEEVGLLRVVGERGTRRRAETLYETPGREIDVEHRPGDEDNARAHARIGAANLRLTARDLPAAFRSTSRTSGVRRELQVARIKGWLDATDLRRANALIDELQALFRDGQRRPRARLFNLTTALLPEQREVSS